MYIPGSKIVLRASNNDVYEEYTNVNPELGLFHSFTHTG
jgi:hypothetical protein